MHSDTVIAKFLVNSTCYDMKKPEIVIGRSSVVSEVDIDMGPSNFISRQHLKLLTQVPEYSITNQSYACIEAKRLPKKSRFR
ncbi:hypothetical protein Ciccas_001892 [Cichlidogyrus casuarinus]|uniref:FHA domain-containing protein n=1 Tax=Cichlidogyrus casuarinus TaxID=1844966 RepID=A0ABD2QIS0_9PLAT